MPRPITNIFLGLAVSAVVGVWGIFSWYAGFEELDAIVERYPSTQIAGLDQFPNLDRGLMSMVAFNLPVVGREPAFPAGRLFMGQFLANVFAIPIILLTEGSRAAPGSLARHSTLWGVFSQLATSAMMCPLYGIALARKSGPWHIQSRIQHPTWLVISSVLIGYGIPAVLMFDPLQWGIKLQTWGILAFTFHPMCISLAVFMQCTLFNRRVRSAGPLRTGPNSTIPYVLAGVVGAVGHLGYIGLSLRDGIGSTPAPTRAAQLVLMFLQIDYALTFAALLTLAWHELRHDQTMPSWRIASCLVVGWVCIGPGATLAVAWALRERSIGQGNQGQRKQI